MTNINKMTKAELVLLIEQAQVAMSIKAKTSAEKEEDAILEDKEVIDFMEYAYGVIDNYDEKITGTFTISYDTIDRYGSILGISKIDVEGFSVCISDSSAASLVKKQLDADPKVQKLRERFAKVIGKFKNKRSAKRIISEMFY